MKKNLTKFVCAVLIISTSVSNNILTAQVQKANTITNLAPGVTSPIAYPNNINLNRITPCDNADVRIFPSTRPQSEIHLSINKQNPQVLNENLNTKAYE
jgi:hypothetical protein